MSVSALAQPHAGRDETASSLAFGPEPSGWHRGPVAGVRRAIGLRYLPRISDVVDSAFVGRSEELAKLGTAVNAARNRRATAIVVVGDPGMGKTALLEALLGRAPAARVVRISGFSSEADLPYAGLDRLLIDLQDSAAALPTRLRRALTVATGREEGDPPDRFQVSLALLSVLGSVDSPVVCAVDDAHLLDTASLAVLAFVARRLKAERVLLVLATRPEAAVLETLAGIDLVRLEGLDTLAGVELLASRRESVLEPRLAVRVVEQLAGHPLALVDLARRTDAHRLALQALSIEPLPPGQLLQEHYRREVDLLPPDARLFVLVAAADTTGDADVVRSAATALGLPEAVTVPAEESGLIDVGGQVRFRHQLVRASVYNAASSVDRQRIHLALASASERLGYPAAATMHAATATTAPDTAVADRLASLADASGARGALLSRAGLLDRASELTPVGTDRDRRRLAAAEAAIGAGAAMLATHQLDRIHEPHLTPADRARLLTARAVIAMFLGDAQQVPLVVAQLVAAADACASVSVELEHTALVKAFSYALATKASTEGITTQQLATRIAATAAGREGPLSAVLRGVHAHLALPHADAAPLVRRALTAAQQADDDTLLQVGLCTIPLALALWDLEVLRDLSRRMIDHATSRGALQSLDTIHWTLSTLHLQLLDVAAAGRSLDSVRELRRAIGYPAEHVVNGAYLAMTGVAMEIVDAVAAAIRATGFAGAWTVVQAGTGSRLIADGHYQAAYERLRPILRNPFPTSADWPCPTTSRLRPAAGTRPKHA